MGNICRSPTAHGVFQQLVNNASLAEQINIESAGTIGYHTGENPDQRAISMALGKGVDIAKLIARKVNPIDYQQQTFILAMDYDNIKNLTDDCPEQYHNKLELLLKYHPDTNLEEVPDPYYGGSKGFTHVYAMIEIACENLLQHIRVKYSI